MSIEIRRMLVPVGLVLAASTAGSAHAQATPATPSAQPTPTTTAPATPAASTPAAPPAVVAGIPVNYDESKVGTYTLPDPLVLANGKRVTDAATWKGQRRPEILRMFETMQFGRAPARPAKVTIDAFDKGTPALGGKAIRRQATLYFTDDRSGPKAELLSYLPARRTGPCRCCCRSASRRTQNVVDDPGIKPGEMWNREKKRVPAPPPSAMGRLDIAPFLESGIGFATVYYGDIEPDFLGGIPHGIRGRHLKAGSGEAGPGRMGSDRRVVVGAEPRDGPPRDREGRGREARSAARLVAAREDRALGGCDRRAVRA